MLPSTKRNLVLGAFLVIVTLVVLYSYCNGNSVCYTFPFFSGLERDRLVKPEVVVTSVIVQTKRPFDMGEISGKSKGKQDESSAKHSELHRSQNQHIDEKKTTDFTEEVEKLYFDHNTTSPKTYLFSQGDKKDNIKRAKETFKAEKHLLPPSDIVGKVAEEILRRANVSEEEANRELIRVEKVDEIVDKEKVKQEHALLKKVKESRGVGGKNSEKKLVRVERVDLTDEEEDEDENIPEEHVPEPEKQVHESGSHDRAKSNNASVKSAAKKPSRMELGMDSKSEDSESAHARRFGMTYAANNTLKINSSVVKREDKSRKLTSSSATLNKPSSTLPPFFANFLNVTAKEREMVNLLHNFTNNSKPLDGPEPGISHQSTGTEKRTTKMVENIETSTAHAEKVNTREKRNPSDASLLDTLVAKLLNITGDKQTSQEAHNKSEPLDKSFNLSTILENITERSQNLVNKHAERPVPDNTALLVKFLKEGSRYRVRIPHNVTVAHTDNGNSRIATKKIENGKTEPQSSVNLKKTLLELANHIDLTRHDNHSETTIDLENNTDLVMLKLLLNQSALQDLTSFNLSRVLKEITGNSLKNNLTALQPVKVKRNSEEEDLGPSRAHSDVKIFRPIPDKVEISTPQTVLSTERKPSIRKFLKGDKELSSAHDSLNTTSVNISVGMGSRKDHDSFLSGSGLGEPGNVESERSRDFEKEKKGKNQIVPSKRRYMQEGRSKRASNGILKFGNIGCEELDPKILLYNRIFKTGSSTTESIVTNSSSAMNYDYKIGTTEDWYDKGKSGPYPGLIIRKANKKLVKHPRMAFVAHFYFRSNLNLPQAHTYINQVRHPIRRLVSHYHYMRSMNRPKDRIKEFLASGERKESLEQCFRRQHKGCKNNVMTRFFCGRHFYCRRGNWRALQKAKYNIKRYYAAVGLLEHFEVYLQILYKRLPKFFPKVSNHDIGKFKYNPRYNFDDVPKDLIGEITRANWADVKLYSFVEKRFWEQAKICGIK